MVAISSPLPVSLPAECTKALKLFNAFCSPSGNLDKAVPSYVLRKAKGFVILTVVKAGMIFSARAGSGLILARLDNDQVSGGYSFSAPSAIGTGGFGAGFQAGVEVTEVIIVLNSRAAVKSFMSSGSITLGGNVSIAAGPLGRNVEGTGTLSSKGSLASMYSYSRTKGLFGGISLEGSIILERSDANSKAYGFDVKVSELLRGEVEVPEFAKELVETIERRTKLAREMNENERSGGGGGGGGGGGYESDEREDRYGENSQDSGKVVETDAQYSFGSQYASGGGTINNNNSSNSLSSKLGGMGSKIAALGSSIGGGRSRSGSKSSYNSGSGNRSRSSSYTTVQPPNSTRFEQDFGDDYSKDSYSNTRTNSNSPSRNNNNATRSIRSNSAGLSDKWSIGGNNTSSSSKMTKARSGSGGSGLREMTDGMTWGVPSNDSTSNSRESFDSLDDERNQINSSSASPFRNPVLTSPNKFSTSAHRTPPTGRSRSNTTNSKSELSASPFADDKVATNSPTLTRPSISTQKSYSTKPWDSEDDELIALQKATTLSSNSIPNPSQIERPKLFSSPSINNGELIDFSQVEVDFSSLRDGMGYNPSPSSNSNGNRSRSSTVGKGIGQAIALFDFKGTEVGDLGFKKGDVITILSKNDTEWWNGRLKLKEGLFPNNYVQEM